MTDTVVRIRPVGAPPWEAAVLTVRDFRLSMALPPEQPWPGPRELVPGSHWPIQLHPSVISWTMTMAEVGHDFLALILCQLDHDHDGTSCVPASIVLGDS